MRDLYQLIKSFFNIIQYLNWIQLQIVDPEPLGAQMRIDLCVRFSGKKNDCIGPRIIVRY